MSCGEVGQCGDQLYYTVKVSIDPELIILTFIAVREVDRSHTFWVHEFDQVPFFVEDNPVSWFNRALDIPFFAGMEGPGFDELKLYYAIHDGSVADC